MGQTVEKKRELHYDLLRIFAAFSVVLLHSASQYWYTLDIHGKDWIVANSYDALFRFGVPVFVMISGALFLAPEYKLDVKRLYRHNILRLIVLYAIWCVLYGIFDVKVYGNANYGAKEIIREMIYGRYHLWFLPMLVGIYMLLPMLKIWVEHATKKQLEYILILFVVVQIGFYTIKALTVTDELHYILGLADVEMVGSYVGYFIWGYYLAHVGLSDKIKKAFYIGFVPAAVLNVVLGNVMAWQHGMATAEIYDSYSVFTFIVGTVLFVFAKEKLSAIQYGKVSGFVIKEVSAATFGIYVMHIMVLELLQVWGIDSMMINNIAGIPLLAIACFIICMIAAALLRRIPFVGRYIC